MSGFCRTGQPLPRGLLLAAPLLLCLLACDNAGAPAQRAGTPAFTRPQIEQGRAIYNFRCYFCHGYSGDAKTLAATFLDPPPRNFQLASPESLSFEQILATVRDGRPHTAMKPFAGILDGAAQTAVAAFVFDEFLLRKASNTRYHTDENGWPKHERYRDAYPFALGELSLTLPPESLSPQLQRGRQLFIESCVSCHDRGKPGPDPVTWEARPLSYPRHNYDHRNPDVDAATSATPYRLHDIRPVLRNPNAAQQRGEKIFQDNCAFCHAADGTGKNWIGAFLEPHPRDLTQREFRAAFTRERYRQVIREGLPGTSMPAWKGVLKNSQVEDLISYIEVAFDAQ